MGKRYVITDIHGCAKTFRALISKVLKPDPEDHIFLLGDYIDRGPDSRNVFDFVFELLDKGFKITAIRGNHEQFLLNSLDDIFEFETWKSYNGGDTTLSSFGVHDVHEIPDKYLSFMNTLPFYISLKDYYLVHAGFNFRRSDPFEDKMAMINIRNFPVDVRVLNGKKIIHGHTPTKRAIIEKNIANKEALLFNLDAGCVYKKFAGMGNLLALELNDWKLFAMPCIDKVKWRPG